MIYEEELIQVSHQEKILSPRDWQLQEAVKPKGMILVSIGRELGTSRN